MFWQACELEVTTVVPVAGDGPYNPYLINRSQLEASVRAARLPDDLPILFTGTGMRTLSLLRSLHAVEPDRFVLSSNLAAAYCVGGMELAELLR